MSIQSEIERISQAKTDIHSAIESKGVTVPDDTLISEMAPYIQQIREAGTVVTSVNNIGPDGDGNVNITIPTELPNPNALTIQQNGSSSVTYNGSVARNVNITPTGIGAAPTMHSVTDTTYGVGTQSYYGHVRLSDSITDTSSATSGCAATPYAVKQVNDNIPIVVHVNIASYDWHYIPGTGSDKWLNVVKVDGITEDCEIFSVVPVSDVEGNYKWSWAECGENQIVIYSNSKENPGLVNSIFAITKNVIQGVNSD